MRIPENIIDIISIAIILLISVGLHEFSHAYVSYKLGDPTPQLQGRLTTNPFKHVDIIGFIAIFLIGFGWGKPVMVNPIYYKDPIKGEVLTSFAGPTMNMILSIIGIILMLMISKLTGLGINDIYLGNYGFFIGFLLKFSIINIGLAVFNMIPIPPLDGYRLLLLISPKFTKFIEQYNKYIYIGLILIILFGSQLFGSDIIGNFISTISSKIFNWIFTLFASIFY